MILTKNIEKDVETRSDTFELDRTQPKEKNKKVIELMKDERDQIGKEFVG